MQSFTALAQRAGMALLMVLPCAALATPPSWAPAHGWRKQNDPTYAGYSGRAWDYDFGVRSGSCDRNRIGQVLGGAVGGVAGAAIGGEIAKGSTERNVAIVIGAVIGAAIGSEVGRRMDKTDRSCVGHSLELVDYGQSVRWTNPNTRVTYQLTPLDPEYGIDGCRRFRLIAHGSFGLSEGRAVACTDGGGVWQPEDDRLTRR
ncbi:MAG: glycine zipper 2TM domain-containing protein [Steroidobacteraceae bacterium]|nr:glycine zipper 2TM domain-containing protein [Pseudomonadota bacterium]MBP9128938.1 glycine zipper 2TM domain-containing protein [Steroidobacteraceae bacterium]